MGSLNFKKTKNKIADVSFRIFLWAIGMDKEHYWREIAKEEKIAVRQELVLLKKANELLRSAYQIAERKGKDTNWDGFILQVDRLLKIMHDYDLEKSKRK